MKLFKARKSTDYSKLDTVALKLQGGPFNTLYVDIMKYPEFIFIEGKVDEYEFKFELRHVALISRGNNIVS